MWHRALLVVGIPLCIFLGICWYQFAGACFKVPISNPTLGERSLAQTISQKTKSIKDLDLLPLGDSWFKYDISVVNNQKLSYEIKEDNEYAETTTTVFVKTAEGTTTLPYGVTLSIGKHLSLDEIQNFVELVALQTNPTPLRVRPNRQVIVGIANNNWKVCVYISLERRYLILIFFVCWSFTLGFMLLVRETISIIKDGFVKNS